MDLVRRDGIPYKTGTSTADVMGASIAVVAVLAALQERERSGRGQSIDLSMQDIVAWATHVAWDGALPVTTRCIACADGQLLVIGDGAVPDLRQLAREQAMAAAEAAGLRAASVLAPAEVMQSPSTQRRRLHFKVRDERGEWPALAVPLRLLDTPPVVRRPGPPLGADNALAAIHRSPSQEKQEA